MKLIPVRHKFATVDDSDFELISQFSWRIRKTKNAEYPATSIKIKSRWRQIDMHKMLLNCDIVDHRDRNTFNNQRSNLRPSNEFQNSWNRGVASTNNSGFKGVCFELQTGKWKAQISFKGKRITIGRFDDKVIAAMEYNYSAAKLYGEFAYLNKIPKLNPAKE